MRPSFAVIALLFTPLASMFAEENQAEQLFVRRILPLFSEKCLACHGNDAKKIRGGFDMRARATVLKGGDSEKPGIIEGRPGESPVYLAVTRSHADWKAMPPKEAEKLNTDQIAWIRDWIIGGAPWPDPLRAQEIAKAAAGKWEAEDGSPVKTSGGLSTEWTNRKYKRESLWAYQPVKKPASNALGGAAIDELIAKRIPNGLKAAGSTNARTFIRRATFDLTGLPPTPEAVVEFEQSFSKNADDAVAALVDRLLRSHHYGERMAQHWLDVTRYADSSGFSNDYERGNAWRYRDYVVRAFNNDMPYDRFVREQIAGDEIDPNDSEKLIATGFLRMGPWELTGMEVEKIARQRFLDDVVNSVGETFLAHSLQCARCHDHKFDPVPTRDFYSIQAVFATTQLSERPAPFLPTENTQGFEERSYLEKIRAGYESTLNQLDASLLENARRWFKENGKDPSKWNSAVAAAREKFENGFTKNPRGRFSDLFNQAHRMLATQGVPENDYPPKQVGFTPQQFGTDRVARKGLERLTWEFERYEPFALAVYNGRTRRLRNVATPIRMPGNRMTEGELEAMCILNGGDPFSEGPKVKPGVLSVLGGIQKVPIPGTIDGRRKAFAEWVASPENPLTTRAIVNRIWMWHFGDPLAGNPNNFGSTGKKPTHPELLDWLAATFVENGWSLKAMHRLIMTSAAYRRSATHQNLKLLRDQDPLGISYAVFKPRRLSAEELRDSMLFASGELNLKPGGIPKRPEIHLEVALQPRQVMGTFAAAWTPNPKPEQRHCRSLYTLKLRGLSDPAMEVFNAPAPDFSCECRDASMVAPQVFTLFNGKSSHARALALAARVLKETKTDDDAIRRCFALVFGRTVQPQELAACLDHWQKMKAMQSKVRPVALTPPREVRREAVEENTGERFSFNEILHSNWDFVTDLQPADCNPRTRALADVCLVLFNTNEFAYVD